MLYMLVEIPPLSWSYLHPFKTLGPWKPFSDPFLFSEVKKKSKEIEFGNYATLTDLWS